MKTLRLIFALALAPLVAIAQNVNVQKAAATNAITANLNFPDARTLTFGTTTPGSITGTLGALTLTAAGTNQNITLTPSGTGDVVFLGNGANSMVAAISHPGTGSVNMELVRSAGTASDWFISLPTASTQLRISSGSDLWSFTTGGALLGGTTTDSLNGRFQLGAPTSATTGIGWGTTGSLFAPAAGHLRFTDGTAPFFTVYSGTISAIMQASNAIGATKFGSETNHALVLVVNNAIAVTVDTSFRFIPESTIRLKGFTVATLPGSPSAGDTAHVTDSVATLTAGVGTTVVGGGANIVPVFYNGTNWLIY